MKYTINSKYKIGQKVKVADRKYVCVGFEYVPQRTLRYIFAHSVDGMIKWDYFYDFEIEMFL